MPRPRRDPRARPRLLAVDLDGTLLHRTSGKPHARDLAALRALARTGVPVSIVTGRLYSGARPTAELLGAMGPVACADGSHVVRAEDHTTLVHHGVRGDHAHALRDAIAAADVAMFVFAENAIACDAQGDSYLEYVATWSTDIRRAARVHDHAFWSSAEGVTAVVAVGEAASIEAACRAIERDLGGVAQVASFPLTRRPGTHALVARSHEATKGSALRWLAEHHDVGMDETVCVGDWHNDIPMFEVAGRAFAMGHAPDEVKAAGTDVLEESQDSGGGVARAVEEAFGIAVDAP